MFFFLLMISLGFLLLVIGAKYLVKGSSNLATKFHIPEMLIGLTIVALGTSAPELIITIFSAQTGSTDLIIGNALGSNFCNILLILGLMALISPIKTNNETKFIHIPIALLSTVVLFIMQLLNLGSTSSSINRIDGIILIVLFLLYFSYPIVVEIKDIINSYKENKNKHSDINILSSIFMVILGIVLLKYGGDFVVDNASNIARLFNISERVIGSTIVAIGTAMPELITSILAVIRKDTDLAIGNLVGSCVLNILLILGVGSVITPLSFSNEFSQNILYLIFCTFIVWVFNFIGKKNTFTRFKGICLLALFSFYIFSL